MIICICSNVTEEQIKKMLPLSLEEIMIKTSAAMCCGACFTTLQNIVDPIKVQNSLKAELSSI